MKKNKSDFYFNRKSGKPTFISRTDKMKKNGMKKLIKLLNEYEEKYNRSDLYYKFELENGQLFCYDDVTDYLWTMQDEAMVICSKHYGFIKWLVKEDKIDRGKIEERISGDVSLYLDNREYYGRYKWLLMLLAIQDEPIEFLISILK